MPVKRQDKPVSVLPLMQLTSGFWAFKTLAAAHELDLFGQLTGSRGTTPRELAASLGIADRPAEMLLTACTALGLLRKKGGRYTNSPLAEEYLVRGKPYYFGGLVEMLDKRLYPGWARLADALRTNRPTTWDPDRQASLFDGADPVMLSHFWEAMHSISSSTAAALAEAVDLRRFHRLLDVGGGSGAFDIVLCRRYRRLAATVYDLPQVAEIAAAKAADAGLADRIRAEGGNFFTDPTFPAGHDVILLSLILHDWGEEENRRILAKCHAALPAGGAVIICELLVNDEKTGPPAAALMSLNMLIETRNGRNYTAGEYRRWLADAGFHKLRTIRFRSPGADGAVIGLKP